ncbi:MAG TPA: ABC transporter substrate-binding protein [Alphaproteobacteria bacterium]|nr:ABC transporter substrate-binding protein [Alphaproteobacteria bacterium]
MRKIVVLIAIFMFGPLEAALATGSAQAAPSITQAEQFVHRVGDEALDLLARYNNRPNPQYRDRLKALISENFDLERGTKFVLGRYWDSATPQQKNQLVALLPAYALEIATRTFFALRARDIQEFTVVGATPSAETDVLVLTHVSVGGSPPLNIGWRVHEANGRLKVVDATVEGISVAITLRDMVGAEVAQKGIAGLIADVNTKLRELNAATD